MDTPLHEAIQNIQLLCCQLLLGRGANPILANGAGLTPLQLVDCSLVKLNDPKPEERRKHQTVPNGDSASLRTALLQIRGLLKNPISIAAATTTTRHGQSKPLTEKSCNGAQISSASSSATTFIERCGFLLGIMVCVFLCNDQLQPPTSTFVRMMIFLFY